MTTNLLDSKKYIGKCSRKSIDSKNYLGSGKRLQYAIKMYGKENFSKEILIEGDFTNLELSVLEIITIAYFNADKNRNFYNITKGGESGDCLGAAKVRLKKYGIPIYRFDKDKNFITKYPSSNHAGRDTGVDGKTVADAVKSGRYCKKASSYFSDKIELKSPDKLLRELKRKAVIVIDLLTKESNTYNSIKECSEAIGISENNIRSAIFKNLTSQKKYKIRYFGTEEKPIIAHKNKRSPKKRGVGLYKDDECLIFYSYKEAIEFLNTKYNLKLPSGEITRHLKLGYKIKDYSIITLWQDVKLTADKVFGREVVMWNDDVKLQFSKIRDVEKFLQHKFHNKTLMCCNIIKAIQLNKPYKKYYFNYV